MDIVTETSCSGKVTSPGLTPEILMVRALTRLNEAKKIKRKIKTHHILDFTLIKAYQS